MESPFLIKESIRFGWIKLREHNALAFAVVLSLVAIQMLGALSSRVLAHSAMGPVAQLLLLFIQTFTSVGAMQIALNIARGAQAGYHELFPSPKLVWRCFAAGICSGVVTIVPLLLAGLVFVVVLAALGVSQVGWVHGRDILRWLPLFVVLAAAAVAALAYVVYFALRFSMVRFAVLDGADTLESLQQSSRLTRGMKWKLLWFFVVLALLNLLGALVFLVGLLVTIPVSGLALAHVYTKLNGRVEPMVQK